jgi:hypothetical protein
MAGIVKDAGLVEIISEVFKPEDQPTIDKLEKQAKGLAGYVEDVTEGVKTAIDFPKALEEAWTAKTDDPEYQKLIADSLELAYQQLLAEMHQNQADYTVQTAEKRVTQAMASKENAEKQLKGLADDISSLEATSLTLISMAQQYMNVLIKYAFYCARALEIYTLKNMSAEVRFDYGYIHPDKEADYKIGLLTLAELLGLYHDSWSTFASLISYREQYDGYFQTDDWVSDYHQLSFADANLLNKFKRKPELHFAVRIQDLPPSRYEAKVTSVYVAFVGAASKHGTITAVIEHSGRYSERKRTNKIVNVALQPRSAVVVAKLTPLESDGGVVEEPEVKVGFWGRGVAAGWHLSIEPSEMRKNAVDLSGLTEIQIWFSYQSFLLQRLVSPGLTTVKDGLLLRDPVTRTVYVTCGGAKFPVPDTHFLKAAGGSQADREDDVPASVLVALSTIPKDGTVLREASSSNIYMIKRGVKLKVPDAGMLNDSGFQAADVRVVPDNALNHFPYGGVAGLEVPAS